MSDQDDKCYGTAWVEPGQGATPRELIEAADDANADAPKGSPWGWFGHIKFSRYRSYRTNLALTGHPLTADDLRRIAEAK